MKEPTTVVQFENGWKFEHGDIVWNARAGFMRA